MSDKKTEAKAQLPGHEPVYRTDGTEGFYCSCGFGEKEQVDPEMFVTHLANAAFTIQQERAKKPKYRSLVERSAASTKPATSDSGTAPTVTGTQSGSTA